MKTLVFLPLLILFGGWETSFSDHVSYYRPSPYATIRPHETNVSTTSASARGAARSYGTRIASVTKPTPKVVATTSASTRPVATPAPQAPTPPVITPTPIPVPPITPSTPSPTESLAAQIERLIFEGLTNERRKQGLSALSADTRLASIARSHSADMLAKNYFSHTDPSGCGSSCRVNNANYAWQAIGENIYWMSGFTLSAQETANKVVAGWMNSSGHRANILGSQFSHDGVGIVVQGTKVYVTALYAKPR